MNFYEKLIEDLYVPMFHKDGEPLIKSLCNSTVAMDVFLQAYKKIAPIPEDEVKELLNYATEMFPDETETFKMNVAKVTYTLAQYL